MENSLSLSDIGTIGSFIVASYALYKSSQTSKEIFLNTLRENIKNVKHKILELEVKEYTHMEQVRIIEIFHDLTFYQGYSNEKKRYLNKLQNKKLSDLQINIEDMTSCILAQCDVTINKNQIKEDINNFLNIF